MFAESVSDHAIGHVHGLGGKPARIAGPSGPRTGNGSCGGGTTGNVPGTSDPLYTADHDPDWFYRANTT